MTSYYVIFFVVYYLLALALQYNGRNIRRKRNQDLVLFFACLGLALWAGFRDINYWADTNAYANSFHEDAVAIWDYSFSAHSYRFSEKGFFFLGVIVKTFTDNVYVYFLFIAVISMFFLYKDIRKYTFYPLLGLSVYIARFFVGRHMMQIRSGLCYLIILWGLQYVRRKQFWKFLLVVALAYPIHHSAVLAIPVYFICNTIRLGKSHIVMGLAIAFLIGAYGQDFVHSIVEDNASDLMYQDYIKGGTKGFAEGLGLANPMLYFQSFILLTYTFLEKKLAPLSRYYYVYRNCYFYSTLILIVFCTYKVLSGRTSTMFATVEIAIIPTLIHLFNKKNRPLALVGLGVALTLIFYMNIN